MAQNYMGSNNINLLEPQGQFGSRLQNGQDSASERYIFTFLNPLTRLLYPEADEAILTYLDDDGTRVEPEYYVPILPFILINGVSGIGTGFSCTIPSYNPKTVVEYLRRKLTGVTTADIEFIPYYEGFKGTVRKLVENKYLIKGVYHKTGEDKIRITELPIGTATMQYTTFLETLMDGSTDKAGKKIPPTIKDFVSICTEVSIDFTVYLPKGKLQELEAVVDETTGCNGIEKMLKLATTVSSTNMHMFSQDIRLTKYNTIDEIIEAFYGVRIDAYHKRKAYLIRNMEDLLVKLSNRARYIQYNLESKIDLRRKSAPQVTEILSGFDFTQIDGDYKYLIKMPMDSVTLEHAANIMKEKEVTEQSLEELKVTPVERIWLDELTVFEKEYDKYKAKREEIQAGGPVKKSASGSSSSGGAKKVVLKKRTTA
jgi:DNA topoisomerase-2